MIKTNEWYLIDPPKPKDEGIYDIELKDGSIIENVEWWDAGGVFFTDLINRFTKEGSFVAVYDVVKFRLVEK